MERPAEVRFRALGVTLRCGQPDSTIELARELGNRLLLVVRYGAAADTPRPALEPFLEVPNRVLGRPGPTLELWIADTPVTRGGRAGFRFAATGTALFGAARFPLRDGAESAAYAAYRQLLELLHEAGEAEIVRIWHYLPGIHESDRGLERYRRFNVGRARAFQERFGSKAATSYPASSAVGSTGDDLLVAFAAARGPVRHVENPRQTSAWRYPPRYGPVGPTFARGAVAPESWGRALFLSGTASITGHETRHPGELSPQIEETFANIGCVLEAAQQAGWPAGSPAGPVKVYLRRAESWPVVRAAMRARLAHGTPVVALEADICRADLEIEIEAVYPGQGSAAPR